MLERRFIAGLTVNGRTLTGRALRYGDEAIIQTGFGQKRERFARGAFGDVGKLDTTLDLHARTGAAHRSHGWRWAGANGGPATTFCYLPSLPATRDADDTIALVRAGVLRGFSNRVQRPSTDEWQGDLRTVTRAGLPSIGVVDRPAFASAQGIELRRSLANPADTAWCPYYHPAPADAVKVAILGDSFPGDPGPKRRNGAGGCFCGCNPDRHRNHGGNQRAP